MRQIPVREACLYPPARHKQQAPHSRFTSRVLEHKFGARASFVEEFPLAAGDCDVFPVYATADDSIDRVVGCAASM